jgi:hypothetical protein
MGQSYRIRTELGINKTINVELDQDFEFLEILSLKIQQSEIYTRNCANYGVVVGRVTANNGLGLPNARVSIFIPIDTIDESNPLISSIYPYKSPNDRNEDGYRYNLLPYEKSYSKHAATGTLPTRLDVLTDNTVVEIYDKYYKYTTKTNDSGDYMIMGAPLGGQTLFMDVDLSDIGEFSLTPQDLIRMGLATEAQVAGNQFNTSTDLNSLPQIINIQQTVDVAPLWGDPAICQIAVSRADFDLRDNANIDIQPTSVFMGSIFSSPDNVALQSSLDINRNRVCRPKEALGNLCELISSPGQILSIRQTINQDADGNPILEVHQLEQAGNIIDGNGVWLTELPMNLDYYITNEFGEKVLSYDPTIGIPTKAKYRFKVKWQQPETLTQTTRRAYFLVPNVREYGWYSPVSDPIDYPTGTVQSTQLKGSYYFGLDWSGYTNSSAAINCEDTFYEFDFNRVYTVSGLIDEFKNSKPIGDNRGRFVGIKEIDNNDCQTSVNKFPVNDGVRNFDLIYFIVSIFIQLLQMIGIPLITAYHVIAFLWNNFAVPILVALTGYFIFAAANDFLKAGVAFPSLGLAFPFIVSGLKNLAIGFVLGAIALLFSTKKFGRIKLPSLLYPACTTCECPSEVTSDLPGEIPSGLLTQVSNSGLYYEYLNVEGVYKPRNTPVLVSEDASIAAYAFSQAIGTVNTDRNNPEVFKSTKSQAYDLPINGDKIFAWTRTLPLGERINSFNLRQKYFDGVNKISVTFDVDANIGKQHYDNTTTMLVTQKWESGTLLTFVNPEITEDKNYLYTANTVDFGVVTGISGTTLFPNYNDDRLSPMVIQYATGQTGNATVVYNLSTGSDEINYKYPSDIEYFQVLTAITISDAIKLWEGKTNDSSASLRAIIEGYTSIYWNTTSVNTSLITTWRFGFREIQNVYYKDAFDDYENQYITILQRGVDPYSPLYTNEYGIGRLLGFPNENDFKFKASTRLNIPIQKLTNTLVIDDVNLVSVQDFESQNSTFYSSYFFRPGNQWSGFTSTNLGYYGALDASYLAKIDLDTLVYETRDAFSLRLTTKQQFIYNTKTIGVVNSNTANLNNAIYYGGVNYDAYPANAYYTPNEDLSGGGFLYIIEDPGSFETRSFKRVESVYHSPCLYQQFQKNPMSIGTKSLNILRTDRLPSSDYVNSGSTSQESTLLQQNLGFTVYIINEGQGEDFVSEKFGLGADTYGPDIIDQVASNNVITTLSECENIQSLNCYSGSGTSFGVIPGCSGTDTIEAGCYVLMDRPLIDLQQDLKSFAEWGFRFKFFYGLCRGVLSQIFVNNWVNGTLYAPPIQVITYYNKENQPESPIYCKDVVYFESDTNNFYYRSSPYKQSTGTTGTFIGKSTSLRYNQPTNKFMLQYPTTIMNLGFKDSFYDEIMFEPSANAYVMNGLSDTSYNDTSDLVNLFVISRITDETYLQQIFNINIDNTLDQLFSRPYKRIDGDLAQLMSINSEEGVIPFSAQYYVSTGGTNEPVQILGSLRNPTMAVWFSSTTENLQLKDYLSPGRINFRNSTNTANYPFTYGIKTQVVPFYQWKLGNNSSSIFGNQLNNWATESSDIVQNKGYQTQDRINSVSPTYFYSSNINLNTVSGETSARGYIFSLDSSGNYSSQLDNSNNKFTVGAPFHFYFGLIKGESALDKFKTKYSVSE